VAPSWLRPAAQGIRNTKTVQRAGRPQGQSDYDFRLDLILDGLKPMAYG